MTDTKQLADGPFKREHRYYVIKRKHLAGEQEARLKLLLSEFELPDFQCVVVESDWPEHDVVWRMIEDRVTGRTEAPDMTEEVTNSEWIAASIWAGVFPKKATAEQIAAWRASLAPAKDARSALQRFIYEATHLSSEEVDGSHWCKISAECLEQGRQALRTEARTGGDALREATKNLLDACYRADALEELHSEIDGSLLDAVSSALEDFHPIVFTNEQVAQLRQFQALPNAHRLTCAGDRGDQSHRAYAEENGEDMGQLEPTPRGLLCPVCDYRQTTFPRAILALLDTPTPTEEGEG